MSYLKNKLVREDFEPNYYQMLNGLKNSIFLSPFIKF